MTAYSNFTKEDFMVKNQVLSSLVLNAPYKVDAFTTSPRIAKIFSLPFGIRIDSGLLLNCFFKSIFHLVALMIIASFLISSLYLYIQKENNQLFQSAKILTNKKLIQLASIQEASSYNKLFLSADMLSLKDPQEIIYIKPDARVLKNSKKLIVLNEYPQVQFSGF